MVNYWAANQFWTDIGDATLGDWFFDSAAWFKATAENTLIIEKYVGKWYSHKKKKKGNENFVYNCAKLYGDIIREEQIVALNGGELKKEDILTDFHDQLDIESQTTPTITEKFGNLFFNWMKGFRYESRQERNKKTH